MSITVDDSYYATGRNLNRHRFSLAHEIAHAILHKEILSRCSFANIAEYREFMVTTDEEDIARLEIQSDCFAGLVLVPSPLLAREFELARQSAESRGISLAAAWDVASDYVCHALGRMFEVSAPVVEKRLRYDKLHEGFL